jgi:hypothetical protein
MKLIRTILLIAVALAIARVYTHAQDASTSARFVDSITVAPVAVLKGSEFTGNHTLGAGIDIGFGVNDFVSIHVANYGFETDGWRSGVVDETEIYGKANFARFANESFVLYGKGGATRDWQAQGWAMGVGLGAQLNLSKSISLASDYTINASFGNQPKYSVARALVQFSF